MEMQVQIQELRGKGGPSQNGTVESYRRRKFGPNFFPTKTSYHSVK